VTQSEKDDSLITDGREYHRVFIKASDPSTDIWIGDDHGHPVVRESGALDVHLLPGFYTVQFTLKGETYPLELEAPIRRTEAEIRAGPTCPKPEFRYYNHSDIGTEPPKP
jgi:hypothetical protein